MIISKYKQKIRELNQFNLKLQKENDFLKLSNKNNLDSNEKDIMKP